MSRQSKQELDFLSNMLQNNSMFSLTPSLLQGPDFSYMRPSEIPQIARRLEHCGSAANYLECFRSGKSNENQKEKRTEMFCQACEDFCGNKTEKEKEEEEEEGEMVSGFVGSGVFLQLQAGSATRIPGMGNFNNGQSIFLKNNNNNNVQSFSNNKMSWQETWENKCQNKMPKPYQFIH